MYLYRCPKCFKESEELRKVDDRLTARCEACNSILELRIPPGQSSGYDFRDTYFEHMPRLPGEKGAGGLWVRDKKQLKEECKKRGVWAKCLD